MFLRQIGEAQQGEKVGFIQDTTRSVMWLVRESQLTTISKSSARHAEPDVLEASSAGKKKKAKNIDDISWF